MDEEANLSVPARTRIGVLVAVALLHVLFILALIRAFAPDFTQKAVEAVISTFSVTVTTPSPPEPAKAVEPAGAAAEAGRKAVAREAKADKPKLSVARTPAPLASNTGSAVSSGARDSGTGSGAGGQGSGTGSGNGGSGAGGGMVQKAVKIAGDINSARDYPIATRDLRIDDYVIIAITVGADGRPTACRVHRPSRDSQANDITCRLAMQRFRFRPATDSAGNPVESVYGWKQQWHY